MRTKTKMDAKTAYNILECMAIDMVGLMGGLSKKDAMEDVIQQRLDAIDVAKVALLKEINPFYTP